jgi:hypothetical protein
LQTLAASALRGGIPVTVAACPLGESTLGKGKRLPHLGAFEDPEERQAAVKVGRATLGWGQQLGIPLYVVDFGPIPLRNRESDVRLGFARREMDEGERGDKALRRALDERKARGQALFDACRAGLEPLVGEAARRGATLLVNLAAGPWQAPTPREAHLLLQEFRGGPLGIVYAPARRAILADLGLGGPKERWADLTAAAQLVELSDRVGLETNLAYGTGELEVELPEALPATVPWLVTGPIDATFREVMRARKRADEFRTRLAARVDRTSTPAG